MRDVILLGVLAGALAACQAPRVASIRGACDAFEAPARPVRGADPPSQRWADRTVEAGVSACGWPRPISARPGS